jgi:hypothetical protein
MRTVWFVALAVSMCFEGLGRRYLPFIPSVAFYFLKDVVLLVGYVQFRPKRPVVRAMRQLYRGFEAFWVVGLFWTLAEVFNPSNQSMMLAIIGLRSYWLWWLAPAVIASVLQDEGEKRRAIFALLGISLVVAALAAIQFASPANSSVNMYSVWNGEEVYSSDLATVASTGRARVASTFAYVTGFTDFTTLVPALLLSLGLDSPNPRVRGAALLGTFATAAVVPMSGSRSSIVTGVAVLAIMLWVSGLIFTRVGRRVLIGAAVTAVLSVVAFPEAFEGVQSRFADETETAGRFEGMTNLFPPVAIATFDFPFLGIGTGMQQNARASMHIETPWDTEPEPGRYLAELGPVGYLLIWMTKLGLMVALFRSYKILKRAGRRGSAAAALAYGALTMIGALTFDHNWQALYFMGCGFVLAEVVVVLARQTAQSGVPIPARRSIPQPADRSIVDLTLAER